ncbi:MAG: hypothetical protein QF464_17375 [Myxococcota bacterium]|nr:hypothetical protein [Myxococcota bacterium]
MIPERTSPRELLARLGRAVDTPVSTDMVRFCEVFERELHHFAEVGVRLDPPALVTMTLGPGREFGEAVGAFLRDELAFDPVVVEEVLGLQRSIDDWMLVRLLTPANGTPELGLYFRRTMSVARAVDWLAARGVGIAERAGLAHLGRLLGASRTGVLAARLAPNEPTLYKVYLHAPSSGDQDGCRALAPVFDHFQFPRRLWRPLLDGLDDLGGRGPGDIFVSLTLGDGDVFDSLKLDLFQVHLGALESLLRRCKLLDETVPSLAGIGRELGLNTAEHCGLALTPESCTLTAYFVTGAN